MNHILKIDWQSILVGEEDWNFLWQVPARSLVMFIVVLVSLRLIGKRAVMQGVFEVALIIALGSAAGDAMFYSKVGLLPAILVFATIVFFYKIINHFMAKNSFFERFLQGKMLHLIFEGEFVLEGLKKEELGYNEIFSDLRLLNVSQLGQVKNAYIEPSGRISIFFYPDEETKYGLSILPDDLKKKIMHITAGRRYSCAECAQTEIAALTQKFGCKRCKHDQCSVSDNTTRVK
ncbi:MAG: DUF421 domain-containing protein [Bacteroidota bacterium]|nr:DUF421 domain-containing protein [Bacteroidota bacterium]